MKMEDESAQPLLPRRDDEMPNHIRDLVDLPDDAKVIAWTSYDTAYSDCVYRTLSRFIDVVVIWMLCIIALMGGSGHLSFMLAYLVLLLPLPFLRAKALKHQYWFFTETHLYTVSRRYACFVPWNSVCSTPLESIISCDVLESSTVYGIAFPSEITLKRVNTGTQDDSAFLCAENLVNSQEFIQALICQRDLIRNRTRAVDCYSCVADEDLKDPYVTDWTKGGLPKHIRDIIGFRDSAPVIAWTSYDSKLPGSRWRDSCVVIGTPIPAVLCPVYLVFGFYVNQVYFGLVFLILVFGLPLWIVRMAVSKHLFWVLTETQLYIVSKQHDSFSTLPGIFVKGNSVLSIPIEHVADCGVVASFTMFGIDFPSKTFVDVVDKISHEHDDVNLANAERFAKEVLNQKTLLQSQGLSLVPAPL
jgi:hypothetical protein